MCYFMQTELQKTRKQNFLTSVVSEAWICAAGERRHARHCEEHQRRLHAHQARRARASDLGLISESCHSERSEESLFIISELADPSQNKLRMKRENQIATQKRLSMTELGGNIPYPAPTKELINIQRRLLAPALAAQRAIVCYQARRARVSNLGLISESCHSERSEESSRTKSAGGPRCTRTAATKHTHMQNLKAFG